jgi:putative phosphoribosyl transferase
MPPLGTDRFANRRAAGRALAEEVARLRLDTPVVVALPRGGVPVAYEVAARLGAPLDIALVRKLGAPGRPELGIGALAEDGTAIVEQATVTALGVGRHQIERILEREAAELARRRAAYRGDRAPLPVAGRSVVLVDDGIATGVTAIAASRMLQARGAARLVTAVPVCPASAVDHLRAQLGDLIYLHAPHRFRGVGAWYHDFTQLTDAEVVALLDRPAE